MLPPVCFTCGRLLADLQLIYEKEIKDIDLLDEDESIKEEKKKLLLDKYKLNTYCCRTKILTYVRLVDIIN